MRVVSPYLIFIAAVLYPVSLHGAQLVISELLANNSAGLRDDDGDYSDWIEIKNLSDEQVELEGWHLTDDPNDLSKWAFPRRVIAPQSFLVVFASEKDRRVSEGSLHTNFRLDSNGEYLALVEPDGVTVSFQLRPGFPKQLPDVSYGELGGVNYYFSRPTPGRSNVSGYLGLAAKVRFSHSRGFFETPFDLTLSTETLGGVIRYTTNGELPTSSTGVKYSAPIPIDRTTTLRAAAFKSGFLDSAIGTQTFLFLDDIIQQSPNREVPEGWPSSWGGNVRDYGMDSDIVNSSLYRETIRDDLRSIPTFSIVMRLDDLFDRSRGIYANPGQDGRAWERPASVELIYPDGTEGFQINAGIRIRGGFSRSTSNPKHAFRLFFREDYGEAKLRYPLFGEAGADEFDNVDLRTFQNYSWSFQGDSRGVFLRDQFSRDTQLAMNRPSTRGDFYHLYINGQYWGLYNTQERSEASYAETYFGGRKEDYDVVKVEAGPYTINATDGNLTAWSRLYNLAKAGFETDEAYQRVQGNNRDGSRNPEFEDLLDVPNLIDYMLVIFYGGNLDAPISNFLQNTRPNNWYGIRNRNGSEGFRFFAHDSEHTLLNVNENRTGPFPSGDTSISYSNPQYLWKRLQANPEFRLLVADHIQRHFFNGGVLSPEASIARFLARKDEIDRAVVGESARWGDAKRSTPFTRNDWLNAINGIVRDYFPRRSSIVVNQLRADGFVPSTSAPGFNQHGGTIGKGFTLTMAAPSGTIYFTRDGSDPRLSGGTVSPRALIYSNPVTLEESVRVKSRALSGGVWSALNEASFTVEQTFTELWVTEIMYHPTEWNGIDGDPYEFIELKNGSSAGLDLSGVRIEGGIAYEFPIGTSLEPGQFVVLARNSEEFRNRYPGVRLDGIYNGNLSNGGETIRLVHATGAEIVSIQFSDTPPWPSTADGSGFSLVPVGSNENPDVNDPMNWRASALSEGSPGADDPSVNLDTVWINEVLARANPPLINSIELYNPTDRTIDIGYWLLSDDRKMPGKFQIAAGTFISSGGYLVLSENVFRQSQGEFPGFGLGLQSDGLFVFSADSSGALTGFSDAVRFGASESGVSFGRFTTSTGAAHFVPQADVTLGSENSGPVVGSVVINEIQYDPSPNEVEFIELKNISGNEVRFDESFGSNASWRLNGVGFEFPTEFVIPPGGLTLVTGGDPDLFRLRYGIPDEVPVLGPFPGVLRDGGERLELRRPLTNVEDSAGQVRTLYASVDVVQYDDFAPWPAEAAGLGSSLERRNPLLYGNDPENWRSSPGFASPGLENNGNRSPKVNAGPGIAFEASQFPATVELAGTAVDDGLPEQPGRLTVSWEQVNGPGSVALRSASALNASAAFPTSGEYVLRLTASDGELKSHDDLSVTVRRTPLVATLVSPGSVWRYLDNGSNQGAIWRAPGFDDSAWRSGRAQLGYGDGDERTAVGFGGNSANKHVTTYFRHEFQLVDAGAITGLTLRLLRDDGAIVFLNGREVLRSNMPQASINFLTYAAAVVGNAEESTFFEAVVDRSILREGENTLAVEIHQANASSSDISFDLELEGLRLPGNQRPVVGAGPDLAASVGSTVRLRGTAADDGLPVPPGSLALLWTLVSGPGAVTFQDSRSAETGAVFGTSGAYVLRLSATDGEYSSEDLILVTITDDALRAWKTSHFNAVELNDPLVSGDRADPDSDGHANIEEFISGTDPRDGRDYLRIIIDEPSPDEVEGIRFQFRALAGRRYLMQSSESVSSGVWTTVREFGPESSERRIEIDEPLDSAGRGLFFRIVASKEQ